MTYSNDIFSFFIYEFHDKNIYDSLILKEQRDFMIDPEPINRDEIKEILKIWNKAPEPRVSFPQANDFQKVISLWEILLSNELSKEEISLEYDFDTRQADYYFNAGRYLGLFESFDDKDGEKRKRLTEKGKKIFNLPFKAKSLELVKLILSHEPFYETLLVCFRSRNIPDVWEIVKIMKKCKPYNIEKESTYERRASTVSGWIKWIIQLTDDES